MVLTAKGVQIVKYLVVLCVLACGFFLADPVRASPASFSDGVTIDESVQIFVPDPTTCAKTDTCDLKQVKLHVRHFRMPQGTVESSATDKDHTDYYGTMMYASFETDSVEKLEKYSFAQFLRGCAFFSELNPDGTLLEYFGVMRPYFHGFMTLMRHPKWSIDSWTKDPLYASDPTFSDNRHYFFEWHDPPEAKWREGYQGNLYGEALPTIPVLYITDMPSAARIGPTPRAANASLEFRTCLYKTAEVPTEVKNEHDTAFAEPITCFEWKDNFVYNHDLKKFERPDAIAPVCLRPLTPREVETEKSLNKEKNRFQ